MTMVAMVRRRTRAVGRSVLVAGIFLAFGVGRAAGAADQPIAIFHAFDQRYADVAAFVCDVGAQGYSHVQIAPAQKSNPSDQWWARYQPVDYSKIDGKGTETDLKQLVAKAHGCGVKIIADVVFNHMADMPQFADLHFPGIGPENFHPRCDINYNDGNRNTEVSCWLGSLPDLDQTKSVVMTAQKKHLKKLLSAGVDGFRFDAAKHMPPATVQAYIDYVNQQSHGKAWNYLEVIEDADTPASVYTPVAAVEDFPLYRSMKGAFSFGGDLRSLKVPTAVPDPRSVTFGRNHDNIKELNANAIDAYTDKTDSYLATAFVLAHEGGTPLVLNWDNADVAFIRAGVRFRQIMQQRAASGGSVKETVLGVVDSPTLLVMERGAEGFFVVNKATARFDVPALDMTLTNIEGCYRELRNNFLVAVERKPDNKKWVTRWGTRSRGGMQVEGRDALYFIREPWSECQGN
jgi:alpha-amylase